MSPIKDKLVWPERIDDDAMLGRLQRIFRRELQTHALVWDTTKKNWQLLIPPDDEARVGEMFDKAREA